jgi:uncharacterized coiled-coil DUF342 family protein
MIEDKAKTVSQILEITRMPHGFTKDLWVRLEDAQQEIGDAVTAWKNLKDTIPKFEAKIGYLENQLKSSNELANDLKKERGELKQKLQTTFQEVLSKLKFLEYESYHGDLKQSLIPTLKEIDKLLAKVLKDVDS